MDAEPDKIALLSVGAAARYLRLNRYLLMAAVKQNQVPSIEIGKRRMISLVTLERIAGRRE